MDRGDRAFSTRAVCESAGVTAPTLYHHFGSKQGLIDAVLHYGFTQYVSTGGLPEASSDPVQDLRAGWDRHVEFGLQHPNFYALLHGGVEPGRPCTVTAPALDMLSRLLDEAARRGMLRAPTADAAAQILAANVGVTLSLITQPEDTRDPGLSARVREAALAAVLVRPRGPDQGSPSRSTAAIALTAALDQDGRGLTPGELTLLRELLVRLSAG
jgi:AcrR family transcriptional regulator